LGTRRVYPCHCHNCIPYICRRRRRNS
jgi:hypothetical protein